VRHLSPGPTQPSLFPEAPLPPVPVVERHPSTQAAFDVFWAAYPRRVGKADAEKAFPAAVRRAGSVDVMLDTIATWLGEWQSRPQFCPYPATWLRRDGWCDDPPVPHIEDRHLSTRESAFATVARRKGLIA
jgi:hypothetical protein